MDSPLEPPEGTHACLMHVLTVHLKACLDALTVVHSDLFNKWCWKNQIFICKNLDCFKNIFKRFYLFIFERGREWEKHECVVSSCAPPYCGPGLQPRHVPWPWIELVNLWFASWHSIHCTTPARARFLINLKWIICLNVQPKTINLPVEHIGESVTLSWAKIS